MAAFLCRNAHVGGGAKRRHVANPNPPKVLGATWLLRSERAWLLLETFQGVHQPTTLRAAPSVPRDDKQDAEDKERDSHANAGPAIRPGDEQGEVPLANPP